MTIADVSSSQWQISVTVLDSEQNVLSGPHSLNASLFLIQIDWPSLNKEGPNGWCPWRASLTLLDVEALAFSIDSRDASGSPSGAELLAQGNAVDLKIFDGTGFVREWPMLYLLNEDQPLDRPRADTARFALGDITLLDGDDTEEYDEDGKRKVTKGVTPEGNLSGMVLGANYNRHTIINNILAERGLPTTSDTISSYPLSVPVQKTDTNSWASEIGRLAGTAGYFFWIDKNDNTRLTPIDLKKTAPDFNLVIGQDEIEDGWRRANLAPRAPAKLIVTGGGGRAIAKANPETTTSTAPEKETSITTEIQSTLARVTITETERLSEREILPLVLDSTNSVANDGVQGFIDSVEASTPGASVLRGEADVPVEGFTIVEVRIPNTSTALRTSRETVTVKSYSRVTKQLQNAKIQRRVARGKAGGDAYRQFADSDSDAFSLLTVEDTSIDYTYRDGRMRTRETRTQRPWCVIPWKNIKPDSYASNRFLTQTNLTKEEEWDTKLATGQRWEYSFTTRRPQGEFESYYSPAINADVLRDYPPETDSIESEDGGPATPPVVEYLPLEYEQDNRLYEGSIEITPLAGNAHKNRERVVSIQGPYVVSDAQCDALAEIIGTLEHGLSLGQQFEGEIPQWIIDSFSPGARADITDAGVTKSYFVDGFTIAADAEETVWGCSLALLGTVGVTPDIVVSPISLSRISNLIGGSVSGASITTGVPVVAKIVGGSVSGASITTATAGGSIVGGSVSGASIISGVFGANIVGGSVSGASIESDPLTVDTISSLVGRFRADSALNGSDNTVADGEAVKQLLNLVSGGADGSIQATVSARPTFNSSSINFNNQPTISTDGVNDFLAVPFGVLLPSDDFTMVHVFRFTTNASLQIGPRDTINNNSTLVSGYTSSNTAYYRVNSTILGSAYDIVTESGIVARSYQFDKSGTTGEVFRDGGSRGTVTTTANKQVGDDIRIGQNGIFANFYALEWAETLIFDTALDATSKGVVDSYISTRYGI